MPEGAGLAEKLLDVRGDGFHPPEKDGTTWHHLPPSTRHPLGPTPPSHHPRAYLWEYTFLERSRWMRLVWDPWTRAPKSCQGGDVSHVEEDPEALQPLTQPEDGGGLRAGLTARTPYMVLTASKGQSVPARLRWESEWQWRRRLCRLCEQTVLSSFAPESHPAPCSPGIPAPACLLPPAEHRVNPAHRNPLSHGIYPCSRWHLPHSHKGMSPGCPQLLPGRQGGVAAMTSPSLGCCRAGHRPEETKATQATLGTESE